MQLVIVNDVSNESSSDFGGFEKHTKGIGMKLLEKMGYKPGSGLGKNHQGIVAPINPKFRPKNLGMGFHDHSNSKVSAFNDLKVQPVKSICRWKRSNCGHAALEEEVLRKRQKLDNEEGGIIPLKVIDMRGPQVRIFTSFENLNVAEKKANLNVNLAVDEIKKNLSLMVEFAEKDLKKIDKQLVNEREKVVALQEEKRKLEIEANQLCPRLKHVEEIISLVKQFAEKSSSGEVSVESFVKFVCDIRKENPSDFQIFNLSIIACSHALPLLIQVFQGWDVQQNVFFGIDVIAMWKDLLQPSHHDGVFHLEGISSPYTQLVMEVVFPAVRIWSINTWDARYPESMIQFIDVWEKVLPPFVIRTILDEIVFPKLYFAVEEWDPRHETVPIHCWIHPWLPLLSSKLETLFDSIRRKLGNTLLAWHPSDGSALEIILPWKQVFDAGIWENLMVCHIVPKLQEVLRQFIINPVDQKLHEFDWVMSWVPAVPVHHMLTLLEVFFFHKWHQVLYHWLSNNPDFEEVARWYMGWKCRLPAEFLAHERMRYQLNIGLDMMNQAINCLRLVQPCLQQNKNYLQEQEQRKFEALKKFGNVVEGLGNMDDFSTLPELSLKEVVDIYAQQNNLLFNMKPGKMHYGHQIYGFGFVNIIVDSSNERVYAQVENGWTQVYLEQLLQMNRNAISKRR